MRGHPERYIYFALAEKLGMTVQHLLKNISSMEITEWLAYFKIKTAYEQQEMGNLTK